MPVDELFDEEPGFQFDSSFQTKKNMSMGDCCKLLIFIFIIYLILNSNIWCQNVMKSFNFVDDMDNVYITGHIFNAVVISIIIIMLVFAVTYEFL